MYIIYNVHFRQKCDSNEYVQGGKRGGGGRYGGEGVERGEREMEREGREGERREG